MSFAHLHGHSTFSFLDGYGTPDQITDRIVELGHKTCAVTDHGNVFAHVPFSQACAKRGIKPIFGCEFYVVDDMRERTRINPSLGASGAPHVTILARTQKGYENLLQLSRLSWEVGFYYKPRIDWSAIIKYQEGLAVLSGCVGGYPSQILLNKGDDVCADFMADLHEKIEHYYCELIPEPGLDISEKTFDRLAEIGKSLNIPLIMTSDAHFPRAEDHEVQDLMLSVGLRKKVNDPSRELKLPAYQFYCSEAELMYRASCFSKLPIETLNQGIVNAKYLAGVCQADIPKVGKFTYVGLPKDQTADDELWRLIAQGARNRKVDHLHEYHDRAVREFTVIRNKGFSDYILAVADVVNWMKSNNTLVVLRGSAGGCLLLWLLGASVTDPIRHGLSFERFYDENRMDPPDVDIDFEQSQRDVAIQYVYEKYGRENCSQIAALSQIKIKAAIQDASFAYGIPRSVYAALSEVLNPRDEDVDAQLSAVTDPAAKKVLDTYPALRIAQKMVGQYRQSSIHACGLLVSPTPLSTIIGVAVGQNRQSVAAVDKKGASFLEFLKIDMLSVSSLDVVAETVRKIGQSISWLETIPLDDERALQVAAQGRLAGIFQLSGGSAARVGKQIGLDTFQDVYAASALCRPGPGDWVETYRRNKFDRSAFQSYCRSFHPIAANIVSEAYGILLYQEQVMRLARELANFEWAEVHKLRKGVQDKLGLDPQKGPQWRQEWYGKFYSGCRANGVSEEEAKFWWHSIETHGGYSFNKSHCVTYGLVGYWMLYLKAHYPTEFYESYLSLEDDPIKIKRMIGEFMDMGGEIHLINPVQSKKSFSAPSQNVIVGGYLNLRGVGPATADKLMAARPFTDCDKMLAAMPKGLAAKLRAAGIGSDIYDTQELIKIAPWFPVMQTNEIDRALQNQFGLHSTAVCASAEPIDHTISISGYVTVHACDKERLTLLIEDELNMVVCKVASRLVTIMRDKVTAVKVGDYVAISGWWSGDTLFFRDIVVLNHVK